MNQAGELGNPLGHEPEKVIPLDQWERIAAVVREAKAMYPKYRTESLNVAIDALTPDDIEAVKP